MSFTFFQHRLSFFSRSLIVITLAGLLLRVLAARGELWFDEILTLKLLDRLSSAEEIFSRLPHVNNHFLNSLWLWIAGEEAHPVWRRFASILLGAATIPAAAMFIRRGAGEAAGLATALIFAVGHIFVHYGSEARGYAGLVLMIVLCADAADRLIRDPLRKGPAVQFALCVALGALFQFTMIAAVGVVGAATAVLMALDFGRFRDNSLALLRLCLAAIIGLAPAVICLSVTASYEPYIIGTQTPFSFADLAEGLAGMARSTLGLPAVLSDVPTILVAALLAAGGLMIAPARLRAPCLIALAVVPLLEIWFRLPNLFYPRFHLPTATFLALLAGAGLGLLWTRGGWRREVALALAMIGLVGHGALVGDLLLSGRGAYRAAITTMLKDGPASFDGDYHIETGVVVEFNLARLHRDGLTLAPAAWDCGTPPDWYVVTQWPGKTTPLAQEERFGPDACPAPFSRVGHYPSARLSGYNWTLYRSSPQIQPRLDQTLISR